MILKNGRPQFPNLTIYKVTNDVDVSEGIDMSKDMAQIIAEMIPSEYMEEFEEIKKEMG